MLDINKEVAKVNAGSALTGLGMVKVNDLVNIVDAMRSGKISLAREALEGQLDLVSKTWRHEAKFK
jgi:hypothetical protein